MHFPYFPQESQIFTPNWHEFNEHAVICPGLHSHSSATHMPHFPDLHAIIPLHP